MTNIMVVEDNEEIANSLRDIAEKEGYNAKIAFNGEDFFNKVEQMNPDLVLLDVLMPGMKFKEILRKLKEEKPEIKIILVTAILFSEAELDHLMEEHNIVGYVAKPFSVANIVDKINEVL